MRNLQIFRGRGAGSPKPSSRSPQRPR